MKVVLVDDEKHALQLFRGVLGLFENTIEIVGEANNLEEGVELINKCRPDVVFLDIDMPRMSGLHIADFFDENRNFEVVFVTAHSSYAIDALRIRAFDYVLKPVDEENLKECYKRLCKRILAINDRGKSNDKLAILTQRGILSLAKSEMVYLEADGVYCRIFMLDGATQLISKPLGEFMHQLDDGFIRVHRSFAVNIQYVESLRTTNAMQISLKNGMKIPLSRTNKDEFIKKMERN
jgi:two-component system, LytTR family, response regulator